MTRSPAATGSGATQGHPAALLRRIGALHASLASIQGDLARAYGDLAHDVENGLAAFAEQSVHALVPARPDKPELLTQKQVAKLLQCTTRTVRRLELEGEIPAPIGQGPRKRWRSADIESLLEDAER